MAVPFDVPLGHIRAFVCFSGLLGDSADIIAAKLQHLFGPNAPEKSFIYKWTNAIRDGRDTFDDAPRSGRPIIHEDLSQTVHEMIIDEPFHSTRSIASRLNVSREKVRHILTDELHLHKFRCKWIPYQLTPLRQKNRVEGAHALLMTLNDPEMLERTITGDQAWFYLDNPFEEQWTESPSDVSTHVKRTIQSRKVMITVLWGIHGFYLVDPLPDDQTYNSVYFITLLQRLKPILNRSGVFEKDCIFPLHLDNAKVHRSQYTNERANELGFTMLPHPPYSPDLAPSDFFLFGYIKEKLKGVVCKSTKSLMKKINSIIHAIPLDMLSDVMNAWIRRLHTVAGGDGNYIHE